MKLQIKKGTTSKLVQLFLQDSSVSTGAGLTGLVYNTAGLTAYYYREGAATATAITLATMTLGTWASGGFVVVDGTNMPGVYQLGIPDAALASGAASVIIIIKGAANLAPSVFEIQLVSYDTEDSVRLGLTALPNAAAEAAGGLYTRGSGAGQINQPANGLVDVNTLRWNGTAVATPATAGIPDVNVKNMNNVATTSITTINANQGTTQPINFTGTGASALAKSDMVDVAGAAVSTTVAQLGVNAVNIGGTAQTGRDIGASVLLSAGTGTGQLDFTGGVVKSNLSQILGTALTETAGQIAAAFKQFFNIASPTSTMNTITAVTTTTTTTNLTNAPTAGDFTATMKTSLNAATPASVTGAVGSVTGNVGGNVVGSVASVTAGVTVTTNNDKTGYALSSAGVQAIWDALTSALTAVGSIGKRLADNIDATISSRLATSGYTAPDNSTISAIAGYVDTEVAAIKAKTDQLTFTTANQVDSRVLTNSDKTGYALSSAGVQAIWDALTSALSTVGSIGKLLVDNVNATISSRLASASYTAPDNATISAIAGYVDTEVAAIKAVTDNLPNSGALTTIQADLDDIQTRLPAALVSGRMDSSVGAVANNAITAASIAADAITDAKVAADVTIASVTGSVGSVTSGVTVTTNNDKTGYRLSATGVQDIWDALTSALTTVGSIGKWIVDKLDVVVSTRLASASYTTPPDVNAIADQVWDEAIAGHAGAGSTGAALSGATAPTAAAVADAVWDEAIAGHLTGGSTGNALNAAGSAGDPWSTPIPGAYGAGTAGKILGDNIDAAISSRLASGSYTAPDNSTISAIAGYVDTEVAAIKAKTDQLTFTTANRVDSTTMNTVTVGTNNDKTGYALSSAGVQAIWDALTSALTTVGSVGKWIVDKLDAAVSTRSTYAGGDTSGTTTLLSRLTSGRASNLDNLDAAVTTRLASASYTAPDNADIVAIKAKTDNLPANPAAVSDIPTAVENADALLARDMAAVVGEADRSALNALRVLRNKVDTSGGTLDVYEEDDTTLAWSGTLTTDAGATPITGVDPS